MNKNSRARWPDWLKTPRDFLRGLLFFGFVFYFLRQQVDLRLIYHGGGMLVNFPTFYWGDVFFREFAAYPGGVMEYACALASQSFFDPWLGPLVVTAMGWLLYASTAYYLRVLGMGSVGVIGYAQPLLILALYARYVNYAEVLPVAGTLITAAMSACLYLKIRPHSLYLFGWILALFTGAVYVIASGAALWFIGLCWLGEWRGNARWKRLMIACLALAAPFIVGKLAYGTPLSEVWPQLNAHGLRWFHLKEWDQAMVNALYLVLPLATLSGLMLAQFGKRSPVAPAAGFSPSNGNSRGDLLSSVFSTVLLLAMVVATGLLSLNATLRAALKVDYYCWRQRWSEVLKIAPEAPRTAHVICAQDRALYHSGRLGDDLPFAQNSEVLMLNQKKYRPDWNAIDLYIDLGFINLAQHHLAESVEYYGERPLLLKRLVLVNRVAGNDGTARIYLNALAKVPFYSDWAKEYLRKLAAKAPLDDDGEVERLRQLAFTKDYIAPLPAEALLLHLLERNKNNRMACEYLLAHYLLSKNLPGFVKEISRLKDFSLGGIPRLHQEAIVLAVRALDLKVDLKSLPIDLGCVQRHDEFARRLKALGADAPHAREILRQDYGNSYYFFYYLQ